MFTIKYKCKTRFLKCYSMAEEILTWKNKNKNKKPLRAAVLTVADGTI